MVFLWTTYGFRVTGCQKSPIFEFLPIFLIQNTYNIPSGDQPAAQGLHCRISDVCCAMLCISADCAVSVRPSVCHFRVFIV